MNVKQKDLELLTKHLEPWRGGSISFNSFNDDHDRLTLRLGCPHHEKEPIGLRLFHCTYIAGPIRWDKGDLQVSLYELEEGVIGIEIKDARVGFVARCASISLYGEPELVIPRS
jgi:hypothetical protein